jgi:phage-related protein
MQEFLDGLHPSQELPFVKYKIDLLEEHGYRLGRPHAAPLGQNIYELRTYANKRQIRCLYFFHARDRVVLSHGLVKKGNSRFGDKVDPKEINRAAENRSDYTRRNAL